LKDQYLDLTADMENILGLYQEWIHVWGLYQRTNEKNTKNNSLSVFSPLTVHATAETDSTAVMAIQALHRWSFACLHSQTSFPYTSHLGPLGLLHHLINSSITSTVSSDGTVTQEC
jgi:hypothetical protein